jgi:hypothetical protein
MKAPVAYRTGRQLTAAEAAKVEAVWEAWKRMDAFSRGVSLSYLLAGFDFEPPAALMEADRAGLGLLLAERAGALMPPGKRA